MKDFLNSKAEFLNPNHVVIITDTSILLYSYNSFVGAYNKEDNTLHLDRYVWDYSNITRKYFKQFINNYTCFKYDSKAKFINLIESSEAIIVHNKNGAVA